MHENVESRSSLNHAINNILKKRPHDNFLAVLVFVGPL